MNWSWKPFAFPLAQPWDLWIGANQGRTHQVIDPFEIHPPLTFEESLCLEGTRSWKEWTWFSSLHVSQWQLSWIRQNGWRNYSSKAISTSHLLLVIAKDCTWFSAVTFQRMEWFWFMTTSLQSTWRSWTNCPLLQWTSWGQDVDICSHRQSLEELGQKMWRTNVLWRKRVLVLNLVKKFLGQSEQRHGHSWDRKFHKTMVD